MPESLWDLPRVLEVPREPAPGAETTLSLAVRDPRSLLAHWRLSPQDTAWVGEEPVGRSVVLRLFEGTPGSQLVDQMPLPGDRRTHLIEGTLAGMPYVAELGVFDHAGNWKALARSATVETPPEAPAREPQWSEPTPEGDFQTLSQPAQTSVRLALDPPFPAPYGADVGGPSLGAESIQEREAVAPNSSLARPESHAQPAYESPGAVLRAASGYRAESREARVVRPAEVDEASPGPNRGLDLTQAVWAELAAASGAQPSSGGMAEGHREAPRGPGPEAEVGVGVSSQPAGIPPGNPDFWFNINAELVIFGGTEPDARVVIAGQEIALRPDGTFTLRLALPDGRFVLAALAESARGAGIRQAELMFQRETDYRGGTAAAPPGAAFEVPPRA